MTRQQSLWLFIWIFIFFLFFCVWNKLQQFTHTVQTAPASQHTVMTGNQHPMYIKILKDENTLSLSGRISDEETKEALIDAYAKNFDHVDSTNLKIDPHTAASEISSFLGDAADNFAHFQSGYITYENGKLELDGVSDAVTKERLEEALQNLKGIPVDNKLTIAKKEPLLSTPVVPAVPEANKIEVPQPKSLQAIQAQLNTLVKNSPVQFLYAKDILTNKSKSLLDKIIMIIKQNPDFNLEIAGHTDSDGTRKHNIILSQKRAESVKEYMLLKGISKDRLRAVGYGESQPLVPNNSRKNKQINRRVEFKVMEKK